MFKSILATAVAAGAMLACANLVSAQGLPTVKIHAVEGSVGGVPLMVMLENKLDEKHGFKANVDFLAMGGGFQAFLMGEYDISNDEDAVGAATARAEGFDIHGFLPYGNLYLGIVASGKSEAKTVADLKGKRVGHFGMESGTTTYLRQLVQKTDGFDLTKEFDLQQAGPAALVPMLEAGSIEAMLNFEPHISAGMVATKGHFILQGTEGYKATGDGFSPWIGIFASSSKWLTENPKLAYGFRAAIEESIDMIRKSDYAILKEPYIAKRLGVSSPEVLDQLAANAKTYDYFTSEWTPEILVKANAYLQTVADEGVVLDEVPEKTLVTLEELIGPKP
ncbi:ABC transporter substrate-binding protein [Shinella sp. BYT-45]|uniref:ABC transporter substrate-binding protein n=1 Tax=Shinella sp. BYT-45 TaxID=3377377 RepID=UPI00397F047D